MVHGARNAIAAKQAGQDVGVVIVEDAPILDGRRIIVTV
jgi:hypothetical protein